MAVPDRLSIGADVVEAAMGAYRAAVGSATYSGEAMQAAIHEALDKLGLREEQREPPAGTPTRIQVQTRLVSDWRQVDAEPVPDPLRCICGHTVGWHDRPGRACARRDCTCVGFVSRAKGSSVRVDSEPSERRREDEQSAREGDMTAKLGLRSRPSATSEGEPRG